MTKALDIIKQGMSTELWGLRFYEQAAARTSAEDGKRVFQSLILEEQKHLDILRGEYAAVSGRQEWVSPEQARALAASVDPLRIFPEAATAQQLIPAGATDEQALEMAMQFEQRGYETYAREARSCTEQAEKRVWEFLAKAEDLHYTFLQKTYEYLKTNGAWFFDAQELPFFEG